MGNILAFLGYSFSISFAAGGRMTFMAPTGQNSWQQ